MTSEELNTRFEATRAVAVNTAMNYTDSVEACIHEELDVLEQRLDGLDKKLVVKDYDLRSHVLALWLAVVVLIAYIVGVNIWNAMQARGG